jgi:hypothetical protein
MLFEVLVAFESLVEVLAPFWIGWLESKREIICLSEARSLCMCMCNDIWSGDGY